MNLFSIRNVTEADFPVLCGLIRGHRGECREEELREALFRTGTAGAMVMDCDGPGGYCLWNAVPGPEGGRIMSVEAVYAAPRLQSQGMEELLFENLARVAEMERYGGMEWDAGLQSAPAGAGSEENGRITVRGTEEIAKLWGHCHCGNV